MHTHGVQLTYCLNVHPVRGLADVLANLRTYSAAVKAQVSPGAPFGVGLWLPASAASELHRDPAPLRDLLAELGLYTFTFNGFPYGVFHGQQVKQAVYRPDWGDPARLEYTNTLIDLLAAVLPPHVSGSISTLPVTYGKTLPPAALGHLLAAAWHCREVEAATGRHIRLAIEPEPDCYLETSAETLRFFDLLRARDSAVGDYLGVCFDTCHLCLQGEDLAAAWRRLRAADICIPKVQVSAALAVDNADGQGAARLQPYDEPVYLHQTRVFAPDGSVTRFPDLGPALAAAPRGRWLVHFHVPLPFTGDGALGTTAAAITPEFLGLALDDHAHLEIETYTFNVLPPPKPGIVDSIAGEYRWLLRRLPGERAVAG